MTHPTTPKRGRSVLVIVLLLVNSAAIWGQANWALEHVVPARTHWIIGLVVAAGLAASIELIGVFLALSADHAEDRDIPAGGYRLGSYAIGIVSGTLNAWHWGWFTAAAVAFALLSTISPFLWGIHSRVNRERTIAPSRRFWHPRASIKLIRHMAWEGIATEAEGIASMKGEPQPFPLHVFNPPAGALATTEQLEQAAERTLSLAAAPVSPAAPAAPRAGRPRAAKSEQERAVRLLLDGAELADVVEQTGVSLATVRTYAAAMRILRDNPAADFPDGKVQGRSVNAELIAIIRSWANREGRVL
ncbi:MAG TPA: helix-turn-helix domain-containing protein [Burkholderiales bacterium]|nr:helix-turn-helix domain-containing protein [Burkholderiales bacterium]